VTPGPWQRASLSIIRGGFEALARRRGMALEADPFESEDPLSPAELRRRAQRAAGEGVSGVFLLPSRLDEEAARWDEALLDACRSAGLPVVMVERNLRGAFRPLGCDLVATDDVEGGQLCTRHLLDRGCRRVGFVTGSPTSSHEGRLAGYLAALQHAATSSEPGPGGGTPWEPAVLEQRSGVPTRAAYRELADAVLARRLDGLVCYQDYTAIGLIMELLTRGVRVPRDVAITGFDDLPIGHSFALGVTTYAFPSEAVAAEAVRVMRRRIEEPAAPPIKVLVPGELVVRESSASA
jgi:LacI family transcriptional regulator